MVCFATVRLHTDEGAGTVGDSKDRDDTFDWSAPGPQPPGPQPPGPVPPAEGQPATPASPEPWGQPGPPAGGGQPGYGYGYGYGYGPAQGDPGWAGAAPAGPTYAHWGLRVGAFLIDWLIPTVGFVVLLFVGGAISAASGSDSGAAFGIFAGLGYLGCIGFWIWNTCLRQGRTGRSVGKSAVGTALVRSTDGSYVGGGTAFLRELAHVVDGLPCYLGYLWPLWDDKRQTFADKICGTLVIRTR